MKTNELVQNIIELKTSIDQLDNPEFIAEQWLTPEDIVEVKKQLEESIKTNKGDAERKCDFVLAQRRKKLGYIACNNEEINSLRATNEAHQKEIENSDKYLLRVCNVLGADSKHKLSVQNGIIYSWKKKAQTVIDPLKLPYEMFRLKDIKIELNQDNRKSKIIETMFKREVQKDWSPILEENIKVRLLVDVLSLWDDLKKRLVEDWIITEDNLLKKEQRTQAEIKERYDSLDEKEKKEKYDWAVTIVDNLTELKLA